MSIFESSISRTNGRRIVEDAVVSGVVKEASATLLDLLPSLASRRMASILLRTTEHAK